MRARSQSSVNNVMFPPINVCNEPPMVPNTDRDRTVIPRTTPSERTVRYPSSENAVVVICTSMSSPVPWMRRTCHGTASDVQYWRRGGPLATLNSMTSKTSATWYRWNDMPKETLSDTLARRLITGDQMMLAHVYLNKGCVVPKHSHH